MLIRSKTKLKQIIDEAKKSKKKVLIKRGAFDIIHPGHIAAIKSFNKIADVVIVSIASDELVRKRKGEGRPINNQMHRAEVVDALKNVDYVFLENSVEWKDAQKFLEYLKPDILAMTNIEPKSEKMSHNGSYKLEVFPEKSRSGLSSTEIIKKIKSA